MSNVASSIPLLCIPVRMHTGEIDGYQYAVIETTGLIAVRRPDGSIRMLPGAPDTEAAVRAFIAIDTGKSNETGVSE